MKSYIISIVVAGIVGAITRALLNQNTATGKILNILTGVLMCVTILAPLTRISFSSVTDYLNTLSVDANYYTQSGMDDAKTNINTIIKAQSEAYILDKAKSLGLEVAVEVELDVNDSVPCGVTIKGTISPYAKRVMETYIEETIGITKGHQKWI